MDLLQGATGGARVGEGAPGSETCPSSKPRGREHPRCIGKRQDQGQGQQRVSRAQRLHDCVGISRGPPGPFHGVLRPLHSLMVRR